MDEADTWHGGRPQPRPLCVRWGLSPFPPKRAEPLPNFRPISIVAKRLDASRCHLVWMLASASPGDFVLDGDPVFPPQQRGRSPLPICGPFLLCPNGWMHHDATRYGGRPQPRRVCVRWGPSPLPKRGAESPPQF